MDANPSKSGRLNVFIDLMRIVERGFIHKLKQRRPEATEQDISEEVARWYMERPGAEHGDSDGVVGDVARFLK
jgi:hypothetical protein